MLKRSTAPPRLRRITESVAGATFSLNGGDVWIFPAGVTVPREFEQFSEPFEGSAPPNAISFDAAAWVAQNKPRTEPVVPGPLTRADILKKFAWSPAQLAVADAQCGFPKATVQRLGVPQDQSNPKAAAHFSERMWNPEDVDRWAVAVRTLRVT